MKKLENQNKFIDKIEELRRQEGLEINIRKLNINENEVYVLFIMHIVDRQRLSDDIIRPLLRYDKSNDITVDTISDSIIYMDDVIFDNDENNIINYVLNGRSVIIIGNDEKYIVTNTKKVAKRTPDSPEIENTIRGPKDAFTENFYTNLSLIRYRIKDPNLRIDKFTIGKRTKTNVGVIYISDIANPKYVNEVKKKLSAIDIDGIVESGYIQKFLLNNVFDLFPQTGIISRSDKASANILEGKICIVVEGSNFVLSAPRTFIEFFDSGDDHYDNLYLGIFSKCLRILSFTLTLTLSSLYVAVVAFHSDILPELYILSLAVSRATVPFNALLEAVLMEGIAEILREASIRLPKQIGPAIGIVGTIVIGQAAVAAGLVSPLMVIIASLSTMCSFVAPDYTIMNPVRILKFMLIFVTGIFGLFGFVMGMTVIVINVISHNSLGVPYFAPIAPFNFKDLRNFIFSDVTLAKKRPDFLNTQDKTRQ
ncbi:spore germination protein [Wukongibacter sp. M2B1]|uniref:spore germination protein n=1 Tax=Wukongibacter sp. M2B1 TaxID=3088895 RepID=UPI003D7A5991